MAEGWRRRGLVLLLFIARLAPSTHGMANGRHMGRQEHPLHITALHQRRDATICPTDYTLCPASASGGCCPTDHSCGTSSCYPTSAAPPAACSTSGYLACGSDQGGGCCPSGYSCDRFGCIPPAGSSYTQTCGANSYLCPTSIAHGCCPNGLACGAGNCYPTSFSSVSLTLTITTTISSSITQTITTVIQTAYSVEALAQPAASLTIASSTVAKITVSASAVPKIAASDNSSGGLSQAQLGGIIGTAVAVVIVVCAATFLILRRLNAVAKAAKAATKSRSSSSRPRPHGHTASGGSNDYTPVENMSIDPLIMSDGGTNPSHSTVGLPRPSAVHSSRSDYEPMVSPPIPAPYGSPPGWSGGYQQVPLSEPQYSDLTGHYRNPSQELESPDRSYSPPGGTSTGYFDSDPALRDQNLRFGHQPRPGVTAHGRQWSDASDVSHQSGSSGIVELDAGPDGDRRSSLQRAIQGVGFSRVTGGRRSVEHRRRSSSGGTVPWGMAAAPGMSARLENVVESEHDPKDRDTGVSEAGKTTSEITTTEQGYDMGHGSKQLTAEELERLERQERQKVKGNLGDLGRGS